MNFSDFEKSLEKMQPRPFDVYVLPAFLIVFAVRSKKGMGTLARRMLFTAGVYMAYRNYGNYKNLVQELTKWQKADV